jgi:hypothetical protein
LPPIIFRPNPPSPPPRDRGDLFFGYAWTLRRRTQVAAQVLDVLFEGFDARRGDLAEGLRVVIFELLHHVHISRLLEFVDLNAQVASRGVGLFLQIRELRFFDPNKQGNQGKPELGM